MQGNFLQKWLFLFLFCETLRIHTGHRSFSLQSTKKIWLCIYLYIALFTMLAMDLLQIYKLTSTDMDKKLE